VIGIQRIAGLMTYALNPPFGNREAVPRFYHQQIFRNHRQMQVLLFVRSDRMLFNRFFPFQRLNLMP
jgi:hypothetical protein